MDDPAPQTFTVDEYAAALVRHVLRRLARRTDVSRIDADDIAQDAALRFLHDPAGVMARYPEPHIYAAACVGSRTEDFRRRERGQRSEGARLVADARGEQAVARPVAALSSVIGPDTPRVAGGYELVDLLADFQQALDRLDPCDRELVVLVELRGFTVTDAAVKVGLSRSHASRRHTDAAERVRAYLQEPLAC